MFLSEICIVEDCKWANDGSKNTNFNIGTNAVVTTDGEYVTIAQSGSGERYVTIPFEALSTDDFEFECIVDYTNSVTNAFTFGIFNQNSFTLSDNLYVNYSNSSRYFYNRICSTGSTPSFNLEDGDKITLKRQNEQWELLVNDVQVFSCLLSWNGVKTFGFYSGSGRKQIYKNLKIKAL